MHKVRFVASTLLDAVSKAETAPASAARAHAYLCMCHCSLGPICLTMSFQGTSCLSCLKLNVIICACLVHRQSFVRAELLLFRLDDEPDTSSGDGMPMIGTWGFRGVFNVVPVLYYLFSGDHWRCYCLLSLLYTPEIRPFFVAHKTITKPSTFLIWVVPIIVLG